MMFNNKETIDLTNLCWYDKRNPDFQITEEFGYDKEVVDATGEFAKINCGCDNCFYGRAKLTEQLINQQKSMEEVIEQAAEKHINYKSGDYTIEQLQSINDFKAGYKHALERSYTEEEVLNILYELNCNNESDKEETKEWFGQFKKK